MQVEVKKFALEFSDEEGRKLYAELYNIFERLGWGLASEQGRQDHPMINGIYNELYEMGMS